MPSADRRAGWAAEVYGLFGEAKGFVVRPHDEFATLQGRAPSGLSAITEHPKMDFADYERRLTSLRAGFNSSSRRISEPRSAQSSFSRVRISGKGGIVRRLGALDPRSFRVNPVASPDEHERAQHYLQRFWRRLPEQGQIVVFDRSWYGRVLVETHRRFRDGN